MEILFSGKEIETEGSCPERAPPLLVNFMVIYRDLVIEDYLIRFLPVGGHASTCEVKRGSIYGG